MKVKQSYKSNLVNVEVDDRCLQKIGKFLEDMVDEKVAVVTPFPVLYQGWEMDDVAYMVKTENNSLYVVGTSHGSLEFLRPDDLKEYIERYIHTLNATKEVMSLVFDKYTGLK